MILLVRGMCFWYKPKFLDKTKSVCESDCLQINVIKNIDATDLVDMKETFWSRSKWKAITKITKIKIELYIC